MLDTHVSLLNVDRGLCTGYALLWNQWAKPGIGANGWRWIDPGTFKCHPYPDCPILIGHDTDDIFGALLSIKADRFGLIAQAVIHDSNLLVEIAAQQYFFSPLVSPTRRVAVKNGYRYVGGGFIHEMSLTTSPAFKPTVKSIHNADMGRELLYSLSLKNIYQPGGNDNE